MQQQTTTPTARPGWPARRIAALAGAIGLALGASPFALTHTDAAEPPAASVPATSTTGDAPHFADLIERVRPAVVSIGTVRGLPAGMGTSHLEGRMRGSDGREVPMDDPRTAELFRRFFGAPRLQGDAPPAARTAGSGFVVDPAGWIVTNDHVVADATTITVTLQDGREFPATLRGADAKTDLALLKIDAHGPLPAVTLSDSDRARVGDWVIAIGNPFGLGGSATAGIISARGRDIHSGPYDDYLQIDAPINQGNSGGPIFDESGRVVGVNTAIYSPNGGSVGIGFAIPANTVSEVVGQLRDHGIVARGWLGVEIQPVTDDLAQGLGLDEARGALVGSVVPDSPAARAGVRVGDVIVGFSDVTVGDVRDLTRAVASAADGERLQLKVWRDGHEERLDARIERQQTADPAQVADTDASAASGGAGALGLQLAPLDRAAGTGEGARVVGVRPGSPAAEDGIAEGDIIRQAGAAPVRGPADVAAALAAARAAGRNRVLLLLERDGSRGFVAVPIS